jgi:hypothetical protein
MSSGIICLNPAPAQTIATIIVSGVGRSGTSMAASALHDLGLYIGSDWLPGLYEDQPMRRALYHFFHDERAGCIARYNALNPKWGFKFPSLHRHMHPPELGQFRAPRLIVMCRDAVAVSNRAGVDPSKILIEQAAMMAFAQAVTFPVLLASYEKAMDSPEAFKAALASFVGIKIAPGMVSAFADRNAYLAAPHEI